MRYFIAAAALLCSSAVYGQQLTCKSSEACLSWLPPARVNDCTTVEPIVCSQRAITAAELAALTYRIYRLTNGIMTALPNTTAGTAIKLINQPRGNQCYAVTAILGGSESVLSNMNCKMIRFPGPTDGGIERPTDGGIERN